MKALVLTVVHHPQDARIRHREIAALLEAGWEVTYAAPFSGYDQTPEPSPGLSLVDTPRASGRRRLRALASAAALLVSRGPRHDVVLVHDPELLVAVRVARTALAARGRRLPPVVWDVHEDTVAALRTKPWLPAPAARLAASLVRRVEATAERHHHLLLAEDAYADRFADRHPVVPNCAWVPRTVPTTAKPRVVYVGHLTAARGATAMVEVGRRLRPHGISVELIGHADLATGTLLRAAHEAGEVDWFGFLPLDAAMERVTGSLAGLSLLHDEPNYRHSRPTKVIEYLAHGVPVVTTPLPLATAIVTAAGAGVVVPFPAKGHLDGCVQATVDAVRSLAADPERRRAWGQAGHTWARANVDWSAHAPRFVEAMTAYATPTGG